MGPRERKEREKAERREEIIKAGEKLFLQKGLFSTTMDDIAKDAELSKGTLYLYFTSKEELYLTIVLRAVDTMYQMMSNAVHDAGTDDVIERLRAFGNGHALFCRTYPDYFHILTVEPVSHDHFMKENLMELGLKINNRVNGIWKISTDIIEDGMRSGLFRENTEPMEVAISLWANSTMMLKMKEHMESHRQLAQKAQTRLDESGSFNMYESLDFDKIIRRNAQRIIISIMKNPPENFEYV